MESPGAFTTGSTDSLKASDYKDKFASDNSSWADTTATTRTRTQYMRTSYTPSHIPDDPTAIVIKAPAAKTLTYTGSAQELVAAGEAAGGTMQYALGTKDAATEPYTTSIPKETNAGT